MFKQVFLCCDDKLVLEKVKNKNKINLNCFRAEQRAVRHEQRELGRRRRVRGERIIREQRTVGSGTKAGGERSKRYGYAGAQ